MCVCVCVCRCVCLCVCGGGGGMQVDEQMSARATSGIPPRKEDSACKTCVDKRVIASIREWVNDGEKSCMRVSLSG
jgi:hypothetical protein